MVTDNVDLAGGLLFIPKFKEEGGGSLTAGIIQCGTYYLNAGYRCVNCMLPGWFERSVAGGTTGFE
jgi:hypothetical protein